MGGSAKESGCGHNTKFSPIPQFGDFVVYQNICYVWMTVIENITMTIFGQCYYNNYLFKVTDNKIGCFSERSLIFWL